MKKLLVYLLALLLLLQPMLGTESRAAEITDSGSCGEDVTWTLDSNGTLIISGTGTTRNCFSVDSLPWTDCRFDIRTAVIEEGVAGLGNYALYSCANLTSVVIPKSVVSIGDQAFHWCQSLTEIYVDENNPSYCNDRSGVLFNKNKTTLIQAPGALSGSYQIPESVTALDNMAFSYCSNLTGVVIPEGVTDISNYAFSFCSSLASVVIPEGVTNIGEHAFYACTSLTAVELPESVSNISNYAFGNCNSMTDVYYRGSEEQWKEITIGESSNDSLTNATIHFNSTLPDEPTVTPPAEDGEPIVPPTEDNNPIENPFTDVAADAYYFEPVQWAVENNITTGMSADSFAPDTTCTRGQIVTFLWRANGSPDPESGSNPFQDVSSSDYYYKAVLWAVENGITSGMGEGIFAPGEPCTRGQVATFLWRAEDQPTSAGSNGFYDVTSDAYYYNAVLWAVANGVTNGMGDGSFAPDAPCTRGQIVTFLYRAMV